jgi:hypothetical protein
MAILILPIQAPCGSYTVAKRPMSGPLCLCPIWKTIWRPSRLLYSPPRSRMRGILFRPYLTFRNGRVNGDQFFSFGRPYPYESSSNFKGTPGVSRRPWLPFKVLGPLMMKRTWQIHMMLSVLLNYTNPKPSGHRKPTENKPKHNDDTAIFRNSRSFWFFWFCRFSGWIFTLLNKKEIPIWQFLFCGIARVGSFS